MPPTPESEGSSEKRFAVEFELPVPEGVELDEHSLRVKGEIEAGFKRLLQRCYGMEDEAMHYDMAGRLAMIRAGLSHAEEKLLNFHEKWDKKKRPILEAEDRKST